MSSQYRCPNCNVTDTRYRSTSNSHVCKRCGHQWLGSTETASPGFLDKILRWAKAHPFGALLTLSIIATIIAFSGSFDPATTTRDKSIWWIIAGVLYLVTFGYGKYRESQQSLSDDEGVEEMLVNIENNENGPLICNNCGKELDPGSKFCNECGTQA